MSLMYTQDDNVVTRQDLSNFDAEIRALHTRSHKPIPFSTAVNLLQDEAERIGLRFGEEQYVLARNNTQLFGLLEVQNFSDADQRIVIGVRSSTNKSLSYQVCAGASLTVCTNLELFGNERVSRKQTTFVMSDVRTRVAEFLGRYERTIEERNVQVARYQQAQVKDHIANHTVIQMLRQGIINTQRVEKVVNEYYEPSHPEHLNAEGERTNWTLFNAATEALKGAPISDYTERTTKLHGLIKASTDYALAA